MKTFLILTVLLSTQLSFASDCSSRRGSSGGGAVIGGIIGGIIGHQIGSGRGNDVATVVGAIGGAIIGGELGCEMEEREMQEISRVHREYAWSNEPYARRWSTNRFDGEISYGRRGHYSYNRNRLNCREYTSVVRYYGRTETTYGVVCQYPDGSYRDVESRSVTYISDEYPAPRKPNYNRGRSSYQRPYRAGVLTEAEFFDVKSSVDRESSDYYKVEVIKTRVRYLNSINKQITLGQTAVLVSTISSDYYKLQAVKALKPVILPNSGSYDDVVSTISSQYYRSEALKVLLN
ncbi:MAG: glycine zipper 2TM domain-containing protein [Oligoflexia bacterium]|nr:glycine zipper 2TM domain-containing protein [Oligoflexia bacterium]